MTPGRKAMPAQPIPIAQRVRRWSIAAAAGLCLGYLAAFILLATPRFDLGVYARGSDFLCWFAAGRMILDGHAAQLYDLQAQIAYQSALTNRPPSGSESTLIYNRPPFFAAWLAPFAWLPLVPAFASWLLLLLLSGGLALWLIVTQIHPARPPGRTNWLSATIVAFAFFPVFYSVVLGQTSLPELLLVTGFYLLYRQGRTGAAGGLVGLMSFKPQLAALFALVLLVRRSGRGLAAAAAVGALWGVVSLALSGPGSLWAYLQTTQQVYNWNCAYGVFAELQQSWRGLFVGLLVPRCAAGLSESAVAPALAQANLLGTLFSAATILVTLAAFWRWRHAPSDSPAFDLAFAAMCVSTVLASPYANPTELTRLVLVYALLQRVSRAAPGWLPAALHLPTLAGVAVAGGLAPMVAATYGVHPFVWLMLGVYAVLVYTLLVKPQPAPAPVTQ
jgi:alpha-1,2-mannosyltransferase